MVHFSTEIWFSFQLVYTIEKILDGLNKKVIKSHYRGKETRTRQRINYLESRKEHHDIMRYLVMAKYLKTIDAGVRNFGVFG